MAQELRKRVPVTRNGKPTTIAKGDLIVIRFVDAAVKGGHHPFDGARSFKAKGIDRRRCGR